MNTLIPVLPIKNSVLFPHLVMPLAVGRPISVAAVEAAWMREDKLIGVFAQRQPSVEEPALADLYPIGTLGIIKKMARSDDVIRSSFRAPGACRRPPWRRRILF